MCTPFNVITKEDSTKRYKSTHYMSKLHCDYCDDEGCQKLLSEVYKFSMKKLEYVENVLNAYYPHLERISNE